MKRADAIRVIVDHFGTYDADDAVKLVEAIHLLAQEEPALLADLIESFQSQPVSVGVKRS